MSSQKRQRLFIDGPIQSALLLRATMYWGVCLIVQVLMVVLFAVLTSSPDSFYANVENLWRHLQLSVVAAILVLPMMLFDIVKLSHRWVGPVFRLRSSLHALSRGEPVTPIRFREGDFWQELAGDFNVVASELKKHRGEGRRGAAADEPAQGAS
jgi:hypothetical protein